MPAKRKARIKKADLGYDYDSIFPKRLRGLLEKTGTSQQALADSIGVLRQSVAQWKDGKTRPDIYYLGKIANYFKVSADYLIGRSDSDSENDIYTVISSFTGLTTDAIAALAAMKEVPYTDFSYKNKLRAINAVLSCTLRPRATDYRFDNESSDATAENMTEVDYHKMKTEAEQNSAVNHDVLSAIAHFLFNTEDFTDGYHLYAADNKGKLQSFNLVPDDNGRDYKSAIEFTDKFGSCSFSQTDVVEVALLKSIESRLRNIREALKYADVTSSLYIDAYLENCDLGKSNLYQYRPNSG